MLHLFSNFFIIVISLSGCLCQPNNDKKMDTIQKEYNAIIDNIYFLIGKYTELETTLTKGQEYMEYETANIETFFTSHKSHSQENKIKNLNTAENFLLELEKNQTNVFFKKLEHIQNSTKSVAKYAKKAIDAVNGKSTDTSKLLRSQGELNFARSSRISNFEDTQCYYKHENCADALKAGGESGLYLLSLPDFDIEPFWVYCLKDPKNGPAWTVVLRRQDGSVKFKRDAINYEHGFGLVDNEYFIGLDILHTLTYSKPQELWVQLEDFDNRTRTAYYNEFAVDNKDRNFSLNVLGAYSGNAGNALLPHSGHTFKTPGALGDLSDEQQCANHFSGGWWFSNCYTSLLTGEYNTQSGRALPEQSGVHWWDFNDETTWVNLKYAHLAIRPKDQRF